MDKPQLRARMKRVRAAIPDRAQQSAAICGHILALPEYARAGCMLLYMPIGSEVDVRPVLEHALAQGRTVCLPVCRENGEMDAVRCTGEGCLRPGAYGIPEPGGDTEIIPLSAVSLLIVPLEGIDRRGMRLGKGGGYYDRLLEGSQVMTLGAVMSWQWEEKVPAMPWDRPLRAAADCRGIHLF